MTWRGLRSACVAVALLAAGCGGSGPASGPVPAAAPTSVDVAGEALVLSTYAWRDQMPTVGDEPTPCSSLCVNGTVEVRSGGPLPEELEVVEVVAVVDGTATGFEEVDLRGRLGPSAYEFVVRGGPVLDPGSTFDLAVRIAVDGTERWLRAEDVVVQRTA